MRIPETPTIAFPDAEFAATQLPLTPGVRHIVADVRSADWLMVPQATDMLVLPRCYRGWLLSYGARSNWPRTAGSL
ncbi:hypothetical protein [Arthrobacter sp. C9C5]|uniref:hypothetical protein n=1 Tax=Arthrobacter sp. C9C5 TaxID=2735267 RepID=UPI001585A4B5|nr:hypothetical protein [Arthrobacter sp. C9C5]NUU33320.1 hypothetical protein [Arthrobacter sp. C9C5]